MGTACLCAEPKEWQGKSRSESEDAVERVEISSKMALRYISHNDSDTRITKEIAILGKKNIQQR